VLTEREHLAPICLFFVVSQGVRQPARPHCCASVTAVPLLTIFVQVSAVDLEVYWPTCCGVQNTFGMSVYSKKCTFPVLLGWLLDGICSGLCPLMGLGIGDVVSLVSTMEDLSAYWTVYWNVMLAT
jgi:hypothetical protein